MKYESYMWCVLIGNYWIKWLQHSAGLKKKFGMLFIVIAHEANLSRFTLISQDSFIWFILSVSISCSYASPFGLTRESSLTASISSEFGHLLFILLHLTDIKVKMYLTRIRDGGVFVQGYQRRIQQNNVSVFSNHSMVRCLNPWLVFIHCGNRT